MTLGSWTYYDRAVTRSLDGYYLAAGEEAGHWMGRGAAELGLSGEATSEGLARLFDAGCHPVTGDQLGRGFTHVEGRTTVTGFSLSFSPPKSVSVLWGLGSAEVAAAVRDAHDAAVATAVEYLEDHAGFARSRKGGTAQADSSGYVAAAFVHRTSRAREPQLHTHVLVANKVHRSDGH